MLPHSKIESFTVRPCWNQYQIVIEGSVVPWWAVPLQFISLMKCCALQLSCILRSQVQFCNAIQDLLPAIQNCQNYIQCIVVLQSQREGHEKNGKNGKDLEQIFRTFSPRLENNDMLKRSSDNFAYP